MKVPLVALVASAILVGCTYAGVTPAEDREIQGRIAGAVSKGEGARLRLSDLTDFSWTRLFVFGPYSYLSDIDRDLGFKWEGARHSGIDMGDNHTLLVFVKDRRVAAWVMQPRDQGDFATVERAGGYDPANAVFIVHRSSDGRLVVGHDSAGAAEPARSADRPPASRASGR